MFAYVCLKHGRQRSCSYGIIQAKRGLCVQCMYVGPYDNEPATLAAMEEYAKSQGLELDFGKNCFHHEIYLSDVRLCQPVRKVILKQLETQSPF